MNGVALRPLSAGVPLASVDTALQPGMTATINGTGFNSPRVNIFTPAGTFGGLVPLAGGTSTQIQITVPANAVTGPATLQVVNSPYNGFQLCLGTTGEGLKKPGTEILPIVRYLGERGKIHQIHMRNIRGGLHDFEEVFPDEGDMDFLAIMRILRDTQFSGSLCPDHMPHHPDDPAGLQAFAFGYGYIKALIQTVNSEV